jgi:S1-C subfamily serine protease
MRLRRANASRPLVLLLGAGASYEAGIGIMKDLFAHTGVEDFQGFSDFIKPRTAEERYLHLSGFLQTQKPSEVTPGYRALAALCAENYFDLILTTNFDPLLEDALAAARLWRKDYLLVVNGIVRPERIELVLKEQSPRVKIVKLHGDLFHRYMAWTIEEMESFVEEIKPQLMPNLHGRNILIVGYSLNDAPVRRLVVEAGGEQSTIWYVHPEKVPESLQTNERVRAVVGPEGKFEQLFTGLAKALEVKTGAESIPQPATTRGRRPTPRLRQSLESAGATTSEGDDGQPPTHRTRRGGTRGLPTEQSGRDSMPKEVALGAQTIDDLIASIVGLIPSKGYITGQPVCTGFVLADPRFIVTEGYSGGVHFKADALTVRTSDGRHLKSRVVRRDTSHPFGPVLIEVPAGLNAPGLRLDASPFKAGMGIRVGVAAGQRVGISSGVIKDTLERPLTISPAPLAEGILSVEIYVAPGASGAPVVDERLAVRGYIIGGQRDEENPVSYVYPAHRWAGALEESEASKPPPTGKKSRSRGTRRG